MSIQRKTLADGTTAYLARYRGPDGKQRSHQCARKADAVSWLAEHDVAKRAGTWVDPDRGKLTFGEFVERWNPATQIELRESSVENDANSLRARILPRWKDVPLRDIEYIDCRAWIGELNSAGLKPATVVKYASTFRKVLKEAKRDRRIAHDPMEGVGLPTIERHGMEIPTAREVAVLAEKIDPRYRALVLFAAYTGLRWGEIAGLRWGHVNLLRGRVQVAETLSELGGGRLVFNGYTKTEAGRRTVPIPRFVCDELATLTGPNPDPDALVFTSVDGQPLRRSVFRKRIWLPARFAAHLDTITPHHLRHYAISTWIANGATILQAQVWAGHSKASVTLDVYGHFRPDDDVDTLTPILDRLGREAAGG